MQVSYHINNKSAYLRIRKKDTILDIKKEISRNEKIDLDRFYLAYTVEGNQKKVEDYKTVGDLGITANSKLSCMWSLICCVSDP
jgi:hypothetical protein